MTGVFRKGEILTQTRTQGKYHVNMKTDRGGAPTNQGTPKITSKPPGGRTQTQAWNGLSLTVLRRNPCCQHLDLRLVASRTVR